MPEKFLPYGRQSISEEDIQAVAEVMRGDWLTTGPAVERFERAVCGEVGASYAVSFSSGTAALHGAMHAAGVTEGDCVIIPPLTFAATGNAAIYCGGRPLFADISPDTLCLDPQAAEAACARARGPVRVIAPVSFAGYPADIESFKGLARERGAVLIEDACHALGASRGSRSVGQEADMTVFSFHPVKHITTAEGGMVVTDCEAFAKRMRIFRSHGIVKPPDDFVREIRGPWDNDMIGLGYNYRLSDIASVLGESQLKRLGHFVGRRREIAAQYREALSCVSGVTPPPDHPGHSYHLFPVWIDPSSRMRVFKAMHEDGIGVQVHYVPVHLHTYYRERFGFREGGFPNAERYSSGTVSLPIFPDMTDEDARRVTENLAGHLSSCV